MPHQNPASAASNRLSPGRIGFYLLVAGGGAAADLWTKQAVFRWRGLPNESPPWWLVEDLIGVETAVNIGAVFGMGAGKGTLFAALSVVAGIGILIWLFAFGAARSWWMLTSLAMVSGGIIGNLYDRLGLWWQPGMPPEWKSGVRDWILMQAGNAYKWPNYNIADSLLVVGASMLVWRSFFPDPEDGIVEAENGEEKNSPAPASHQSTS
ncbi:signal peptidase II [Planctomycetaceae bacterium SH139]